MWYLAFRLVVSEVSYFPFEYSHRSRSFQSIDLGSSIDWYRDSLCGSVFTETRTIERIFRRAKETESNVEQRK